MTDIVERLRLIPWPECHEAADEIERLRAALSEYACHKIHCKALHWPGMQCTCGLDAALGPVTDERDENET